MHAKVIFSNKKIFKRVPHGQTGGGGGAWTPGVAQKNYVPPLALGDWTDPRLRMFGGKHGEKMYKMVRAIHFSTIICIHMHGESHHIVLHRFI